MGNNFTLAGFLRTRKQDPIARMMWTVVLSLVPAGIAGVVIFGIAALRVILVAAAAAVLAEFIFCAGFRKKITILDGSAVVTGILLAFCLPPEVPLWLPAAGAAFAIIIGKQVFGGRGKNFFNPALAGRVFLTACWPKYMFVFTLPFNYDSVTSATPLALLKEGRVFGQITYLDLFLGKHAGCIGEVCILALLAGAAILLAKKYISWYIPVTYIFTTGFLAYVFGGGRLFGGDWLFSILSGGLILGAFFMATDYVTAPLTVKGQLIFGFGCGLLTAVVRLWGRYPEGVAYSILMMNAAVPFINRYTKNRIYGT